MKIFEVLKSVQKRLQNLQFVDNAKIEAQFLLESILDCSNAELHKRINQNLSEKQLSLLEDFVVAREAKKPIAYIIKQKGFWKYDFEVNDAVLIPRSDSETLIEAVISNIKNQEAPIKILDLGVGSGCLIISLLLELKTAVGVGVDISSDALLVADANIQRFNLQDRIKLYRSNWFEKIAHLDKFDIIVSNPPYISYNEQSMVAEETLKYEPDIALFAEEDGLKNYKIIAEAALNFLTSNGKIYLEVGFSQSKEVEKIFNNLGYKHLNSYKDLNGIERCLEFKI
ncbi:MAG: peptide chain release factor N(5)-glutamine methyltransferase [Rickettsiaceae bacterium]|nr:peptide chain release factor N(5)-glutamine methyltransferase [Rickettsiaceae bacterium]